MGRDTKHSGEENRPSRLFGYEVLSRLGRGAGARIYLVREPVTGLKFALKHVKRKTKRDIRFVHQLENELKMGGLVRHEAIRRPLKLQVKRQFGIFKVTEAVLVVEYVEGVRLSDMTDIRVWETLVLFAKVGRALAAMHAAGVLHCDIKPSNIMLTSERKPKLIDLGQACRTHTTKKRIQGTPEFMAPEQANREVMTERTDIFGFGATLYWALTGRTIPTVLVSKRKKAENPNPPPIPAPIELNPVVPQAASDLVMACLKMEAKDRPGSMAQVAEQFATMGEEARRAYEARVAAHIGDGLETADGQESAE